MDKQQVNSIIIHTEQISVAMDALTDVQLGELMRAFFKWCFTGEECSSQDGMVRYAFASLKAQAKIDLKKYDEQCERNRINGVKGGRPKKTEINPQNPVGFSKTDQNPQNPQKPYNNNYNDNNNYNKNNNENCNKNYNDNKNSSCITADKSATTTKFRKPDIDEIKSYLLKIGKQLDVQYFFDYYEANGWKVGKNSMKDWKATVRTWLAREEREKNCGKKEKDTTTPSGAVGRVGTAEEFANLDMNNFFNQGR